jgi:hypothetical protein
VDRRHPPQRVFQCLNMAQHALQVFLGQTPIVKQILALLARVQRVSKATSVPLQLIAKNIGGALALALCQASSGSLVLQFAVRFGSKEGLNRSPIGVR